MNTYEILNFEIALDEFLTNAECEDYLDIEQYEILAGGLYE